MKEWIKEIIHNFYYPKATLFDILAYFISNLLLCMKYIG